MKIRVFGFKFDEAQVPTAMSRTSLFDYMIANPGGRLGNCYQFGATRVRLPGTHGGVHDWIAGMLLRIRDSQAFMKLVQEGGRPVLTSEQLGEGEKLAEVGFFLVHPQTGSGLLTHHYHATSVFGFGGVCSRLFNAHRKHLLAAAVAAAPEEQRRAVARTFKGRLVMGQLSNDANLPELVRQLERVNSAEFSFTTVKTHETFLRGITEKAKSEKIRFVFPPETDPEELAGDIETATRDTDLETLKVTGTDRAGKKQDYWLDKNPLVFGEYDYDDTMRNLRLDLSNWGESIANAGPVHSLGRTASSRSVMQLLLRA